MKKGEKMPIENYQKKIIIGKKVKVYKGEDTFYGTIKGYTYRVVNRKRKVHTYESREVLNEIKKIKNDRRKQLKKCKTDKERYNTNEHFDDMMSNKKNEIEDKMVRLNFPVKKQILIMKKEKEVYDLKDCYFILDYSEQKIILK